GIDPNLVKHVQVTQRVVQLAHQDRPKIDDPLAAVVKANAKRVSGDDFERAHSVNRRHKTTYFKGLMGRGFRPSCNRCQSALPARCNQARSFFTTFPETSVRRKSRPWNR